MPRWKTLKNTWNEMESRLQPRTPSGGALPGCARSDFPRQNPLAFRPNTRIVHLARMPRVRTSI
jgi:hypothetical protein